MRTGVWFIATACVLLCAVIAAHAQENAPQDSTTVPQPPIAAGTNPALAVEDSLYSPRYRFSPVFTNKMTADVSKVGMTNDFHTGLRTPWGSIFDFAVSNDEKNYRLQNLVERSKLMRLTDIHTFNPFWNGSANYSDSRVFSRTIAIGGGIQDFIINDKQVNLGSTYKRDLIGARTDLTGSAGAIQSQRAFKDDEGIQSGVNGGVAYDIGDRVVWQGRGALRRTWDQSSTSQQTYYGLGSDEDSLSTKFRVAATDSAHFEVSSMRYQGDREFTDQARGSQGGQISGEDNVFPEGEHRTARNTTLSMTSALFDRLHIDVMASHDEFTYSYDIQDSRFSRTVTDGVTGNVRYTLPWKTTAAVSFENNKALRDLGPKSIGSVNDKRKKVGINLQHQFTKTLSLGVQGSTQLQQSFYIKYAENPRDRDQIDTSINAMLTSRPFRKISATISAVYSNSQFVNIDSTQSENNRVRTVYELRPAFTYYFNDRLLILQTYGLSFDYTDYDFKSTENYLDRSLTFSNEFQYRPTKAVGLKFRYDLLMHDNGSYLPDPVSGVDELSIKSEDRRDRTLIRVDYLIKKELGIFCENVYSRSEDRIPGSDDVTATTDGQVELGSKINYAWKAGKILRITVSHVKRFSPFGTELEKDYWNAQSEFSYPF